MRRRPTAALALLFLWGCDDTASGPADAAADDAGETGQDAGAPDSDLDVIPPDADPADVDVGDSGDDGAVDDPDTAAPIPFEVRLPAAVPPGAPVPVLVHAVDSAGAIDAGVSGRLELGLGEGSAEVRVRRGVGSVTLPYPSLAGTLTLNGVTTDVPVPRELLAAPRALSGALSGDDLVWQAGDYIRIDASVEISAEQTLRVEAGVWVEIAPGANVVVRGNLVATGTAMAPIVWAPRSLDQPWGGLIVEHDAAIDFAFFVGAGGDSSRSFGHSGSQPVIFGDTATVQLRDTVIQDCVGKATGAAGGQWTIERALVTRTDTGGEFEYAALTLRDAHYFDFPSIDASARDDDNDAIYLLGDPSNPSPPEITIERTTFIGGADDGIDHNGSRVRVTQAWIEDFDNECVAASSGHGIFVGDTALVGCAQGLEAGYGSPDVVGEHLLVLECGVGVRFGDGYADREHTGTLHVTDSVVYGSTEVGVQNLDLFVDAPRAGALTVSNSVIDSGADYDGVAVTVARALLDADLLLGSGSPGEGTATDGGNPGLATPRPR